MSNAKALFEAGRLADAVQELNQALRARPSDGGLRVFLFELLCFQGELERAAKQLDVIATQSATPGAGLAVQMYRGLVAAEDTRRAVFHGDALPKFITPPRAHVERYLMMLKRLSSATPEDLGAQLEEAEDESPSIAGERNGQPFSSLRDADDRLAGVLEVFHDDEYLWVPFDQIVKLAIKPPARLRELMWAQARLEVVGQPEGDVFIPTRYPDSSRHPEDNVKLGRLTEWEALHDRMVLGMGQRVFLIDDEEVSFFDFGEAILCAVPGGSARPMSSVEPALDLETLLAPVSTESPSGADLRYAPSSPYDSIKAARREADGIFQGKAGDDRSADERVAAATQAWRVVEGLLTDALARQSKDLQFGVWLLEAETYIRAFKGAANGLEAIGCLLDSYWDTLYPAIEKDDEPLSRRAALMDWINTKLGAILKNITLSSGSRRYSLAQYEFAQTATTSELKAEMAASGLPSTEQFLRAMSSSGAPHLTQLAEDIEGCLAQIVQLEKVTDARFVALKDPLSFNQVRKVLEDCRFEVGRALRSKKPPPETGPKPPADSKTETTGDVSVSTGSGIWDRARDHVTRGELLGLRLAQEHIQAASSGRERFLRQLELSEICIEAEMYVFAYPILDELGKLVEDRDLVTWEDAKVVQRTWSGLAAACRPLAVLHPESVARGAHAQERLRVLNEAQAVAAPAGADADADADADGGT